MSLSCIFEDGSQHSVQLFVALMFRMECFKNEHDPHLPIRLSDRFLFCMYIAYLDLVVRLCYRHLHNESSILLFFSFIVVFVLAMKASAEAVCTTFSKVKSAFRYFRYIFLWWTKPTPNLIDYTVWIFLLLSFTSSIFQFTFKSPIPYWIGYWIHKRS